MTRFRVAAAQHPEQPGSDDRVYVLEHAVAVLDGASAADSSAVSTATYVNTLGTQILRGLADRNADLSAILATAIQETATLLALRKGHSPSSTVTIARAQSDAVDLLVLGDSQVVTPLGAIRDDRLANVAAGKRASYRRRLAEGTGYDDHHRQLLRALQAEQALYRNKHGGFWIAEADPQAAHHAITSRVPIDIAPWLVFATDGAYRPAEHLHLDNWSAMARSTSDELHAILRRLHNWESETDPNGTVLPRAKRHDDKTLVAVIACTDPAEAPHGASLDASHGPETRPTAENDRKAVSLAKRMVDTWVLNALTNAPDHAATVDELRALLWQQLPPLVRDSYASLVVGDELSRVLRRLPDVEHDKKTKVWRWLPDPNRPTLAQAVEAP